VLRACNRVLKPGGRLVFLVLAAAGDLGPSERERALEVGHVDAGPGYAVLLQQADFVEAEVTDVTDVYLTTLENWHEAYQDETQALHELIGEDDYTDRQTRRVRNMATVGEGLVGRYLVTARRPHAEPTA
jgi:SAM-dependent methyltransferase